ncbi:hypothetical protein SK128_025839 [Halocaridina rubra]|uniref:Bcl-2 Bcl-2 homology region 1-3 domain-containing protein n=1 Tax=Halocaridina rubra TaxID=373956 RepID=A0AAN8ZWI9_HALRR
MLLSMKLHEDVNKHTWRHLPSTTARECLCDKQIPEMAISSPHGDRANKSPTSTNDAENVRESNGEALEESHLEARYEENKDTETASSLSSQENLASPSSPSQFNSPRASSNPSPSQLHSPLSSPLPSSSTSSLQSPAPSLPSPYQQNVNISVEQLTELALQDSENNNVDENSNQGFDHYAEVRHDMSVRPRVRPLPTGRDQPDRAAVNYDTRVRRRSRSNSFSHRRNLSEDLACSPTASVSFKYDNGQDPAPENDRLPQLPNCQDRRDDWSNPRALPSRDSSIFQSVRCILPLNLRGGGYGPQPSGVDSIEEDARDLLTNFTCETLRSNYLQSPESSILPQGFRNPALYRVGQELRRLADTFAETEERRNVQRMAETVHLESINMDNFFQLCTELFMGGITRERIVALFTFVGDVAVYHVRRQGYQCLQLLMKWSLKYLVEHICSWVKKAGGWGVVLSRGANALLKTAVITFCALGAVAAGVYILKTIKDW